MRRSSVHLSWRTLPTRSSNARSASDIGDPSKFNQSRAKPDIPAGWLGQSPKLDHVGWRMVELRRVTPRHLTKPHLSRWPFGLSDSPTADPHEAHQAWGVHRHEVLPPCGLCDS